MIGKRVAAMLVAIWALTPAHSIALTMTPELDPTYLTSPWFGFDRPSNTYVRLILNEDRTGKIGIAHCQVMKERCDDWHIYKITEWEYAKYQILVHHMSGTDQEDSIRFTIRQVFSNLELHIHSGNQVLGPITMISEQPLLEASRVLDAEMKP